MRSPTADSRYHPSCTADGCRICPENPPQWHHCAGEGWHKPRIGACCCASSTIEGLPRRTGTRRARRTASGQNKPCRPRRQHRRSSGRLRFRTHWRTLGLGRRCANSNDSLAHYRRGFCGRQAHRNPRGRSGRVRELLRCPGLNPTRFPRLADELRTAYARGEPAGST